MSPRTILCALFALAAAAYVAANSAGDVCSVAIAVNYNDDEKDFTFSLSKEVSSSTAILQPGTFKIEIIAADCEGNTVFSGESSEETIDGTETEAKTLQVVSVDQSVIDDTDASVDFAPIITSLTVNPAVAKYGTEVTLTATGRDLPSGNPTAYQVTLKDEAGADVNGDLPDGSACTSGGASCSLKYVPANPDNGNVEFEFTATDGSQDSTNNPKGYFLVDPNGQVDVTFVKISRPKITNVDPTPASLLLRSGDGDTFSLSLRVEDDDLATNASEAITLAVTVEEESAYLGANNELSKIECGDATVTEGTKVTSNGESYQPFTVSFNPVAALGEVDHSLYGETVCKFTISAADGYGKDSQEVTFSVIVTGDGTSEDGPSEKPQVIYVIHEKNVNPGDSSKISISYKDVDDNVKLDVTQTDLGIDSQGTLADCQSGCLSDLDITIPTAAEPGEYTVTITLTDSAQNVVTQLTKITVDESARRRREAANVVPVIETLFRFENGKFTASLPEALVDVMDSPEVVPPNVEPEAPAAPPQDPPSNGMATSTVAAIAGGAAGFVVIVGAVAAVIVSRRRQNAKTDMADRVSCSWDLTLPEEQQLGRRSTKWSKAELPVHESLP